MNFSTTADDFTILKNGIDANIEIIRHDETGYYNVTKIANLINKLKSENNGLGGNVPNPDIRSKTEQNEVAQNSATSDIRSKRINSWLKTDSTKELIKACKFYTDLDEVVYELKAGTPTAYAGTYVHRYLYDQFLNWLDVKYAIRISRLLDDIHQEANKKIIEDKDDKIDKLQATVEAQSAEMKKQSAKLDKQSAEIAELLGYAKNTNQTLHEVQDDLTETKEEVKIAKSYLEEKSKTSTKNPSDESKHHYFGATTYIYENNQVVKFVSGQKSYVDKTIDRLVLKDNHKVIVKPFYNANGIDLRQNVHEEFIKRRAERIKEINTMNVSKDKEFNKKLLRDIREHNIANPDKKRVYLDEKRKTPLVRVKDIAVNFKKLSFTYTINPHIGFNEVLQIILDVNEITQESPLPSDEE